MIERTLWYLDDLDDPKSPTNQGGPFKRSRDEDWESGDAYVSPREQVYREEDANLVGSRIRGSATKHAPVIDLDVPARLIPSKTPGHSHLYIDVEVGNAQYFALLKALYDAGILERNYYEASVAARQSFLRLRPERRPDR